MKLFLVLYILFLSHKKECDRIQQMLEKKTRCCSELEERVAQLKGEFQNSLDDRNARLAVNKFLQHILKTYIHSIL